MKPSAAVNVSRPVQLFVIAVAAIALVVTPRATPASTAGLDLGPITVANGTAYLAGAVDARAAGGTLTVNGQPLGVDAAGNFAGSVSLNGASAISIALSDAGSDQAIAFEIPLTAALLGQGGVIPAGVLDSLEQAGVSLLTPVGAANERLTVSGSTLDRSQLVSLSLNGKDVLGALAPDGSFSVRLPATTKTVTLTATDRQGNSETIGAGVSHASLRETSVSAAAAVGLRIVKVRIYKQNALRRHRVRMVVTVKDRRGRLVRGAKISVRSTKAGRLVHRPKVTLSGHKGRATFVLRLREAALGKRLVVVTVAKTPRATAKKTSAISLPRSRHKGAHS
jgi:hypothetical protein